MNTDIKEQTEKRYPVKNLSTKIKVITSTTILNQIKYLNSRIHEVEWSGILFYTTTGDMSDAENLIITLQSIYPMDKGSSGYTEFETSEDFIGYRMDHPETLQWKIGLIHSHNNMQAYFSGTDMDEINVTARYHNAYLSIVTNNRLDIVGKLAFVANTNDALVYTYKSMNGDTKTINIKNEEKALFVYDCDIELNDINIDGTFKELVDNIITSHAEKAKARTFNNVNTFERHNLLNHSHKNSFDDRQLSLPLSEYRHGVGFNDFEDEDDYEENWEDNFPIFWLSFGDINAISLDLIIEELNVNLKDKSISTDYFSQLIESNYELYKKFFTGKLSTITYLQATESLVDYFELFAEDNYFMVYIINRLNKIIVELEQKHLNYE